MPDVPENIAEFKAVAALVLTQLYKAFPDPRDIDRDEIARRMGAQNQDWHAHRLSSGRLLGDIVGLTIGWLKEEGYIRSHGNHPAQRAVLTTKGFSVMDAIPIGLKEPVGAQLTTAIEKPPGGKLDFGQIGDLIGGIFGGFTKSMGSG
jgi:hypothetical protein